MELSGAAASVTGNRYAANFDAHHLETAGPVAAVADGMGDSPGSAFASRTSVGRLAETPREAGGGCSAAALREVVGSLHDSVRAYAREHPGLAGCTLTAMVGDAAGGAWVVQIGDALRTPSTAVDRLLELTLAAGGTDNATAIVIRVDGRDIPQRRKPISSPS